MGQGLNRSGRCQHLNPPSDWSLHRDTPTAEAEGLKVAIGDEKGQTGCWIDHDGSLRQGTEVSNGQPSVLGTHESPPPPKPFRGEHPIEISGVNRTPQGRRHTISVVEIVDAAAQTTRSVTRCHGRGVIQEEQGGPGSR
jgi:hypothetical protein